MAAGVLAPAWGASGISSAVAVRSNVHPATCCAMSAQTCPACATCQWLGATGVCMHAYRPHQVTTCALCLLWLQAILSWAVPLCRDFAVECM